jgi:hypothetical protein
MRATMLAAYRATGADPPWGDPRAWHAVGMEGYFWRITEPRAGVVVVVLAAVNRDAAGGTWGLLALATHPGGFVRSATVDDVWADPRGLGLRLTGADGREVLMATDERLRVDLGPGATVEAAFAERTAWPRRFAFGGIGPAQCLPGLSQYWHPHTLGARVSGTAGAGDATFGPARLPRATSIVVALGGEVLRLVSPVVPMRVAVDAGGWRLQARGPRHRIDLEGHAGGAAPHVLPVPVPAERGRHVAQSAMHLAGTLRVRVRRGGRTVFAGESALAGLERGLGPVSPPRAPGPTPR